MADTISITHIGTATAIIHLPHLTILTDPYFSPPPKSWTGASGDTLTSTYQPAICPNHLPPIDLVLLSHEDHKDNLDDLGRTLLNGRRVITTKDGAQKLDRREGITGLRPWESTIISSTDGFDYVVVATPCEHLPGGECIGFLITGNPFGRAPDGRFRALWYSGDTMYLPGLGPKIAERFDVGIALINMGKATVRNPWGGSLQITMDAKQAVQLVREIRPLVVVPMHFEGWRHFKEGREGIERAFRDTSSDVALATLQFLTPGRKTGFVA
jgi:L-ascorbate metabolism protein UlaG (beta-lactamase superfamily)